MVVRHLLDSTADFDVLALQEVGGLAIAANSWELDPVTVPDFTLVATSAPGAWLNQVVAFRNSALCSLDGVRLCSGGLIVRAKLANLTKPVWFGSMHFPHSGRSLEAFDDSVQDFVETVASLPGCLCVGADLNVDVHQAWLYDGRACLAWDVLHERGMQLQSPGEPTWVSHRGTQKSLDYFITRLASPLRVAAEAVVLPHLRMALGTDHHCVALELSAQRLKRRDLRDANVFHSCGRWQFPCDAVRDAVELLRAYRPVDKPWTALDFAWVARCSRRRSDSWRFRDPPAVRQLVDLKHATPDCVEREKLSRRIAELRAQERAQFKARASCSGASGCYPPPPAEEAFGHASVLHTSSWCEASGRPLESFHA